MNSLLLWTLPLLGGIAAELPVITVPQSVETSAFSADLSKAPAAPKTSVMPLFMIDDASLPGRGIQQWAQETSPDDAFDSVATPSQISESNDANSENGTANNDKTCSYVVFDSAANIAVPGFDRFGGRLDQDGAVIYEGMAIRIEANGKYFVRYIIETPATEVTLRMQFAILRPSCDPFQVGVYERCGTITLPPVTFRPVSNALAEGRPLQWKVQQQGFSRQLKDCNSNSLRLDRTATATFGTPPE